MVSRNLIYVEMSAGSRGKNIVLFRDPSSLFVFFVFVGLSFFLVRFFALFFFREKAEAFVEVQDLLRTCKLSVIIDEKRYFELAGLCPEEPIDVHINATWVHLQIPR